jgi:hypothetical protein
MLRRHRPPRDTSPPSRTEGWRQQCYIQPQIDLGIASIFLLEEHAGEKTDNDQLEYKAPDE